MSTIYRTNDVNEAVELASRFKQEGRHDWFRGQPQNWPLRSSLVRLGKEREEEALQKMGRFEHWVKTTPGLECIAEDVDALFAVAQHYGMPTNYIDFTRSPSIACFFAADNPNNVPLDGPSCIMCLQTSDLKAFWESMSSDYPPPELIVLNVPNLWRLEAQEGCFLFCPYQNFEWIYDVDRILFPATQATVSIPRSKVYPTEKSSLEITLDQYFMTEKLLAGTRMIETLSGFRKGRHLSIDRSGPWNSTLLKEPPPIHDSWDRKCIRDWIDTETETYADVSQGRTLTVSLPGRPDPRAFHAVVQNVISECISQHPLATGASINWHVEGEFNESVKLGLGERLGRLWDGLRILPYRPDQLTGAMAQCAALWAVNIGHNNSREDVPEKAASICFGESIEVEVGSTDCAYSRSYVAKDVLLKAVRGDIDSYLSPRYAALLRDNTVGLLQAIQDPSRLFAFSRLADIFVAQLAPFQVVFRRPDLAVFFSPVRLHRFGLS